MKRIIILLTILINCSLQWAQMRMGNELLLAEKTGMLSKKRIGVVSNAVSLLPNGTHVIDSLISLGYNITCVFSPEHGFGSNVSAGEKIQNQKYKQTQIPVYSLYGEINKPTADMLKNVDVLVYDIQDVGARFYTYISTMTRVMEGCAENNREMIILDRPNPLGGILIDGPVLEPAFKSFVGIVPIPVAYGMTCGELAMLIKGEKLVKGLETLSLKIIEMKGYKRSTFFDDLKLDWISPSPNIPDFNTALLYPGTCLFEATNLSEGRGTPKPFLLIGAPFIDAAKVVDELKKHNLPGITLKPASFTPVSIPDKAVKPKHQDAVCKGVELTVTDKRIVRPVELGLMLLHAFYSTHPDKVQLKKTSLARLGGTDKIYQQLTSGRQPEEIIESWQDDINSFKKFQKQYLIYN